MSGAAWQEYSPAKSLVAETIYKYNKVLRFCTFTLADLEGACPVHVLPPKGPDSFVLTYKIFKT